MSETSLSRAPNPDREYVEVRPLVPIDDARIADAVAKYEGSDRTKVMRRWIAEGAAREHRKASLIWDYTRGNPPSSDTVPGGLD